MPLLINAYCTHRAPPRLAFAHDMQARRDMTDPELGPHLNGFIAFVMDNDKREMTATRYAVIRHIERVRHHLAFEIEDDVLDDLALWAGEANAILVIEDGTVRAADGATLVDPMTGDADEGAEVLCPRGAHERKARTTAKLIALGIPVLASLPGVDDETEVELRSAPEVLGRCCALFAVAVRAESLNAGEPLTPHELNRKVPLAAANMSPLETAFFESDGHDSMTIVQFVWRYEALGALMWALGLLPELPLPTKIVDVPLVARTILDHDPAKPVSLRPAAEILDALDLTYRLHWATTNARVTNKPTPGEIDPGIVMERHHALNWLVRFENAEWDDVTTPT